MSNFRNIILILCKNLSRNSVVILPFSKLLGLIMLFGLLKVDNQLDFHQIPVLSVLNERHTEVPLFSDMEKYFESSRYEDRE